MSSPCGLAVPLTRRHQLITTGYRYALGNADNHIARHRHIDLVYLVSLVISPVDNHTRIIGIALNIRDFYFV
jgi:hypothetical protein